MSNRRCGFQQTLEDLEADMIQKIKQNSEEEQSFIDKKVEEVKSNFQDEKLKYFELDRYFTQVGNDGVPVFVSENQRDSYLSIQESVL